MYFITIDYDVIIIGAGPAGLTAGMYCARGGLSTLIVEQDIIGGIANFSYNIENYPGFPTGIKGLDLMDRFYDGAEKAGAKFLYDKVINISIENNYKTIITKDSNYSAYCIILATGGYPNKTLAINEEKYMGKGISFCTLCDGPDTKDKTVLVIGSGDSAIDQSLYLTNYADHIILSSINEERMFDSTDIVKINKLIDSGAEFIWNSEVYEFRGNEFLASVVLKDKKNNNLINIPCEFCFEFIGYKPNSQIVENTVNVDEAGYIITNKKFNTSISGVFAIGDVREKAVRQITTAVSDGAAVSCFAKEYIRNNEFTI